MHRRFVLLILILIASAAWAEEPGPALEGRLLDERGVAIAGGVVELVALPAGWAPSAWPDRVAEEPTLLASAVTDEHGAFRLPAEGVPAGAHALQASAPGHATLLWQSERYAFGGRPLPGDVELQLPEAVVLEGLVLDERGEPVARAQVAAMANTWNGVGFASTVTGSNGRYVFGGLPRMSMVGIAAQDDLGGMGYAHAWVESDRRVRRSVVLRPGRQVSGRLIRLTPEGKRGIAGARVVALVPVPADMTSRHRGNAKWTELGPEALLAGSVETDAEGAYSLDVPNGGHALLFEPGLPMRALSPGVLVVGGADAHSVQLIDGKGKPLKQGSVRLSDSSWRAELDGSGRVLLPELPGSDRLQLLLPGRAAPISVESRPRLVPPSRQVTGTVRLPPADGDANDSPGAPAPRATVRIQLPGHVVLSTATDEQGRFSFPALPPGRHELVASLDGLKGRSKTKRRELVLQLEPAASALGRVAVKEEDGGAAVGDAWVLLRASGFPDRGRVVRTGPTGRFVSAALARGDWKALVLASGFMQEEEDLELGTELDLALRPAVSISVSCVNGAGRALSDAEVLVPSGSWFNGRPPRWSPRGSVSKTAGPDGRVRFSEIRRGRSVTLIGQRPGHARASQGPEVGDEPIEVELTLPAAGQLRGVVRDPEGAPVTGAQIGLEPDAAGKRPASWWIIEQMLPTVLTDEEGRFELSGLPEGAFLVKAGARRYTASERVAIVIAPGEPVEVELQLGPGAELEGLVLDPGGAPAGNAVVQVEVPKSSRQAHQPGGVPEAETGDDGRFLLEGLVPGLDVTVHATRDGDRSPPRVVAAGAEGLTLRLVALGVLEGHVLASGEPVGSGQVHCEGAGGTAKTSLESSDGAYRIEGIQPGVYNCEAKAGELGKDRHEGVVLVAGRNANLDFDLVTPVEMEIRVIDSATRAPVEGVRLRCDRESGTTDSDGKATLKIDPLAASPRLRGWKSKYSSIEQPLPVPLPSRHDVEMEATVLAKVSGRVVDAQGSGVAEAQVSGAGGRAETDASGAFDFETGSRGKHSLRASRTRDGVTLAGTLELEVTEEGTSGAVVTVERQARGSVRITVVEGGRPAGRATVMLKRDQTLAGRGTTGSDGVWAKDQLTVGEWPVKIAAEGQGAPRTAGTIRVEDGKTAELTLEVPGGRWIRGRVVRGDEPVEAAEVSWSSDGSDSISRSADGRSISFFGQRAALSTRSDRNGGFELGPFEADGKPSRLVVKPPAPALPSDRPSVTRDVGPGEESIVVDLLGARVSGTVTAAGRPEPGARVIARISEGAPLTSGSGRYFTLGGGGGFTMPGATKPTVETVAGPGGRFDLAGLDPSLAYDVAATKEGFQAATQSLPRGSFPSALVLDLGAGSGLSGRAVNDDGPYKSGFTIWARELGGAWVPEVRVSPKPDGSFTAKLRPDRSYLYRAGPDWGFEHAFGTLAAGEPLELRFRSGGTLKLTLTEGGRPVEGVKARQVSYEGHARDDHLVPNWVGERSYAGSDSAGLLIIEKLPAGHHVIDVESGAAKGRVAFSIAEGEVTESSLQLTAAP